MKRIVFSIVFISVLSTGCAVQNAKLVQAAKDGDVQAVQNLLSDSTNVDSIDENGATALVWAASRKHTQVVKLLIEKGAEVDAKDSGGKTALWYASQNGYTEVVKLLLDNGADVNTKNNSGETALWIASWKGHTDIVRLLLENSANVDLIQTGTGITPLWIASQEGHIQTVKLLLESGADVDTKRTTDGVSALWMASQNNHPDVVKVLLDNGAEVNVKDTDTGITDLWIASSNGHTEVVMLLLDNGADIHAKRTSDGVTALWQASWRGHTDIVKLLLDKGSDVHVKRTTNGLTALWAASYEGHTEVVRHLLENGADVDAKRPEDDMTALDIALEKGHTQVVGLLEKAGVNHDRESDTLVQKSTAKRDVEDDNARLVKKPNSMLGSAVAHFTEIKEPLPPADSKPGVIVRSFKMLSSIQGHTGEFAVSQFGVSPTQVEFKPPEGKAFLQVVFDLSLESAPSVLWKKEIEIVGDERELARPFLLSQRVTSLISEIGIDGVTLRERQSRLSITVQVNKDVDPSVLTLRLNGRAYGTLKSLSAVPSQRSELADRRYSDPKGYFRLVPPVEWSIQDYPDDVRGKVAFISPESNIDFRILVNAVKLTNTDELLEFCRNTETRLGVPMNVEKFDFYGHQAVRRSFIIRGQQFLYVDFLIGKLNHNLAYSAPPSKYDKYLPVVLKSMETYEPILKQIGDKESKDHLVAKKLRLGRLMLEAGRSDLALEYAREGLAIAPENQELLKLKQEVNSQFKKPDEQSEITIGKRFENKKFDFSFNVPENVNIYTADDPGPMVTRIKADTPMWLVSSVIPSERINVKITKKATMSYLKQILDISSYSSLRQYERISVKEIKIGKNQDKAAYEHIHRLKLNPPKKLRQILFVHKGNAFGFTCSTSDDRYETANRQFFDLIFRTMEFK